jgi:hypothetical protein
MSSFRWYFLLEEYDEYLKDPEKYESDARRKRDLTPQQKESKNDELRVLFFTRTRASQERFFRKNVTVIDNPFLSIDELFEVYIQAKWKSAMGHRKNKNHLWCYAFRAFKEADVNQLTKGAAVELAADYIHRFSPDNNDSASIPSITEWIEPLIKWQSIKLPKKVASNL